MRGTVDNPADIAPSLPFEERVRHVIALARRRRQEHEAAKRTREGKRDGQQRTPCEQSLQRALADFSHDEIQKLAALMYAGRDDEAVLLCHRTLPSDVAKTFPAMAFEKLPLDEYLERGIDRACDDFIALNADFNTQYAVRYSEPADLDAREWYASLWQKSETCRGDIREMFSAYPKLAWAEFDAAELGERVKPASAIEIARKVLHDHMIVITGPTGVGKSSLATAMHKALRRVAWIKPSDVTFNGWGRIRDPDSYAFVAKNVPTLIIDHTGYERWYPDVELHPAHVILGNVIRDRFARRQQTIITTVDRNSFAIQFGQEVSAIAFSGTVIALDPMYRWDRSPEVRA